MRVCELIEWLKKEDPLSIVQLEIKDPRYIMITSWCSDIREVKFVGFGVDEHVVRIIAHREGAVI